MENMSVRWNLWLLELFSKNKIDMSLWIKYKIVRVVLSKRMTVRLVLVVKNVCVRWKKDNAVWRKCDL